MNLRDFIFSNNPAIRVRRHLLFWAARIGLYFMRQCSIFYMKPNGGVERDLLLNVFPFLTSIGIDILYCYTVVYWMVPNYLVKRKYRSFGFMLVAFTALICTIKAMFDWWLLYGANQPPEPTGFLWMELLNNINNGPPVICALFVAIKMLTSWYLKEDEKLLLAEENINAELQLLKAQVHPHFLFNTLNNIYSFTLTKSPQASALVLKLSDTLKYMITDCDTALVPLEKEIKMIHDYIGLEKVRYGNRLQLTVDITGNYQHKMIAPLLLIPFVENSFKHGTSQMLNQPWINLHICIKGNKLLFSLSNSRPPLPISSNGKNGIGLKNVQKRLHLLYPQRHQLNVTSQDETYTVYMELPLEEAGAAIVSSQKLLHAYR